MGIRYDIIIPHFGQGHLTDLCLRCLQTIRLHSSDYRLLFIDNASPEFDKIEPELRRHPHLLIRNSENLGFVKAVNEGLQISTAPRIVIMNNDTEAVPHWLVKMDAAMIGDIGLAGPCTTTPNSWQGQLRFRGEGIMLLPASAMLAFFCTMFKREVFQQIGLLDEGFGAGFGDDDWFCHQAKRAGFKLALIRDLVIPHHHRSTFKTLYSTETIREMQDNAMRTFKKKCVSQ
jgi:GT2 family glycosyltransferase